MSLFRRDRLLRFTWFLKDSCFSCFLIRGTRKVLWKYAEGLFSVRGRSTNRTRRVLRAVPGRSSGFAGFPPVSVDPFTSQKDGVYAEGPVSFCVRRAGSRSECRRTRKVRMDRERTQFQRTRKVPKLGWKAERLDFPIRCPGNVEYVRGRSVSWKTGAVCLPSSERRLYAEGPL